MVKHLEHDYELTWRPTGLVPHFWDTIEALGGLVGIFGLATAVIIFYFGVLFYINYSRQRRESKKRK